MDQEQADWMSVLLADLRSENEQLRAIVKEVATAQTTYDDFGSQICVFCVGEEDPISREAYHHAPECIVTLARALMEKREAK